MIYRILSILTIASLTSILISCQNGIEKKIASLKYVSDMPYICRDTVGTLGCGDSIFWNVVVEKDMAIPYLLDALDDTTRSDAGVMNTGGNFTVADIAYQALGEIIHGIPTFELLGIPFDSDGCGYCSYWFHLRESLANRQEFKRNVTDWYRKNENRLHWIESNRVLTCDCSFNHPNGGHYEVKE